MKKARMYILIILLAAIAVGVILYGKKKDESEQNNVNVIENKTTNIVKQDENIIENKTTETNETKKEENKSSTESNKTETVKATTPSELIVYREGSGETVASDVYTSSLGYTMRYSTEYFKVSFRDNIDWYEAEQDMNCVAVEKENDTYSNKVASLSNSEKTTVNGYEAVYVTRRVEGQYEKIFYVNTGSGVYRITTSCHDNVEYLEGLGKIMDAMVQTFAVK